MYLHLGQESIVRTRDILGIFDLDTASLSRHTRDYLAAAEKAGRVVTVTGELPKSFIVTTGESPAVYISQISAGTLKSAAGMWTASATSKNREPPENRAAPRFRAAAAFFV